MYQFIDIATTGKAFNQRTEARHKEHHTIAAATSIKVHSFRCSTYLYTYKQEEIQYPDVSPLPIANDDLIQQRAVMYMYGMHVSIYYLHI